MAEASAQGFLGIRGGARARMRRGSWRLTSSFCTLALGPANPRGARYEGGVGPVPGPKEHQGCKQTRFQCST